MNTKFTKGDWIVYDRTMGWGNIRGEELVIGMGSYNEDYTYHYCSHKITIESDEDEARANAHLIAAAPDMYEMLEMLVNGDSINDHSIEKEVKALLTKARGEL